MKIWLKSRIIDYLVRQNHCSRCDFDNKTFHQWILMMWQSSFYCHCRFTVFVLCIFVIDLFLQNYIFWTASYHQLSQWLYNIYTSNWQFDIQGLQRKTRSGLKMCFLSWTLNVLLYAYQGEQGCIWKYILTIKTRTRNQKSKRGQCLSLIIITSFGSCRHQKDSS